MRVLDADKYRVNVSVIATFLIDKTDEERVEAIGKLAIITGVPIIIVAKYIYELYGNLPGLAEKTVRLMKFYQIDEVRSSDEVQIGRGSDSSRD